MDREGICEPHNPQFLVYEAPISKHLKGFITSAKALQSYAQ